MYVDAAASPLSLPDRSYPPADTHVPARSPIVLDRRDLSGRRRVVAVTEANLNNRSEYLRLHADLSDLIDQLLRTTTRHPDRALSDALRVSRLVGPADGTPTAWVIALLDGSRLLLAAHSGAGAVINEGDDVLVVPPDGAQAQSDADHTGPFEPLLYETGLEVGDRVALFCGASSPAPSPEAIPITFQEHLDRLAGAGAHLLVIDITSATLGASQRRSAIEQHARRTEDDAAAIRLRMEPVPPIWVGPVAGSSSLWTRPPAVDCLVQYRRQSSSGPGFRSRLPRGSPISARGFLAVVLVIAIVVATVAAWGYRQAQAERAVESLPAVEAALTAAIGSADPPALTQAIEEAEGVIAAADGRGDPDQVVRIRHQIVQATDLVNGTTRLSNLSRVGRLPATIGDPAGAKLVVAGGHLYLVAGSVFQIDAGSRHLTEILTEEMGIARDAFGRVAFSASDGPSLLISDGAATHRFLDGAWQQVAVQDLVNETEPGAIVAGAFNGRLYLLDTGSGNLVVTTEDGGTRSWLQEGQEALPDEIVGMAIDGSIHLLARDGSLVRLADGQVLEEVRPGLAKPLAVDLGRTTSRLYIAVAHEETGYISLYDRASGDLIHLALPAEIDGRLEGPARDAFLTLTSFAVDEAGGAIFWIGDDVIWRAELPAGDA